MFSYHNRNKIDYLCKKPSYFFFEEAPGSTNAKHNRTATAILTIYDAFFAQFTLNNKFICMENLRCFRNFNSNSER
ncbi:hypothetical protein SAMN05421820_104294 [Pedobacter steynii]|uniref:Uncharacterized protein n=1 Tax=Pedobacter steynii TaxID=430522 RepID=A0A1G9UVD2_9SPHI|nr:hypothetical protein SAMN05421820_104294 [Pedobacter steynii]